MEKGIVQKPYIPVIRIATPVYIYDKLQGVLIINIFINKFMNLLTSSPIYDILITNEDGFIIKLDNFYYDKTRHLNNIFDKHIVNDILNRVYAPDLLLKKLSSILNDDGILVTISQNDDLSILNKNFKEIKNTKVDSLQLLIWSKL